MLLVFTHNITPRLKFIFKQICTQIIGIDVDFTSNAAVFLAHHTFKLSYTNNPLGEELFIKSTNLLFEHGINDINPNVQKWEETQCFFAVGGKSELPFDIFAASFYLISRYEEYLPHVRDRFGRFEAINSLAFKHNFLHQPVVDIWA